MIKKKNQIEFWLSISIVNLLIVAILGTLMRYKIGFEFPYFDQKNIQHSHSHFAFSGWISQTIMVLMIDYLFKRNRTNAFSDFSLLLWANLICSYGMLVSFFLQGYGVISIIFSTTSVLLSFLFTYAFFKELRLIDANDPSIKWFKSALIFNVLSSAGTFLLAYMMSTHQLVQNIYLGSLYFYLHFQYNGWFFFAGFGLLIGFLYKYKPELKIPDSIFYLFAISCPMAYFLSTLWAKLPVWIYSLAVISAILQLVAWWRFLKYYFLNKNIINNSFPIIWRYILLAVLLALSFKFLLQMGSTIPEISKLAFGFRPIVIAYLHLVLLAITSVFLVAFIFSTGLLPSTFSIKTGLIGFIICVYLNELVLGIQGVASFSYTPIPFANEILFGISTLMAFGLIISLLSIFKNLKFKQLL